MINQRHTFTGMNLDADPHAYQAGDYGVARNLRLYNPLTQGIGDAEAIPGHTLLPAAMPNTGVNEVIGACEAAQLESVFYFVYNSLGRHAICQLNYRTQAAVLLLEWGGLNLDPAFRVSSACVVEKTLFWTDNRNEPRKLNLQHLADEPALFATLKATEPHFLDVMRPGPQYALVAAREFSSIINFIPGADRLPTDALEFSYRYVYHDDERSVLAPWSAMLFAPSPDEGSLGTIRLRLPAGGRAAISNLVKRVELVVRRNGTETPVVGLTLPRAAWVGGATVSYYGDQASTALDAAAAVKPFDYVPRRARTVEYEDNRLFYGGNTEGYARPSTPLAIALTRVPVLNTPATTVVYERVLIRNGSPATDESTPFQERYFGLVSGTAGAAGSVYKQLFGITYDPINNSAGGYLSTDYGAVVAWNDFPYSGDYVTINSTGGFSVESNVERRLVTQRPTGGFSVTWLRGQSFLGVPAVLDRRLGVRVFKSNAQYEVGVAYFDWAGRSPGVSDGRQRLTVPAWDSNTITSGVPARANWTLDPAQTGAIPTWAESYCLVRTRNQSVSQFVQGSGYLIRARKYTGTSTPTVPVYGGYTPLTGAEIVGGAQPEVYLLDIGSLAASGRGYAFAAGDRCRLGEFEAPVMGMAGDKVLLGKVYSTVGGIGGLFGIDYSLAAFFAIQADAFAYSQVAYELYTPYASGEEDEPFYEASERFAVLNPGESTRAWAVVSGTLYGDCWAGLRKTFHPELLKMEDDFTVIAVPTPATDPRREAYGFMELMSPADDAGWSRWTQELGRVTGYLRDAKEEDKFAALRFSNPFVQGTQINGLSSFEPLNEEIMPREFGPITKLQAVRGNLLVIQEQGTSSAYIGQAQLKDTQGQTLISISDRVVGSHRPLDGGFGCQHPETVRGQGGYVYWWDCRKGVAVRYANDGITEISAYGMVGYFANRRRSQLGAGPRPMAWFDALHREYVLQPGIDPPVPAAAFCEAGNRWTAFFDAAPDYCVPAGGSVISFKGSNAYLHDADPATPARLLGTDRGVALALLSTAGNPKAEKVFLTLHIEGSAGWSAPVITTPEGQSSLLAASDLETLEGQHYAAFLRDLNTPTDNPLEEGDELRSSLLTVGLVHHVPGQPVTPPARLRAVTIGAAPSSPY